MTAQLAEFRENYLARLRVEKRDGELVQKKVANNLVEDARAAEEKELKAKLRMNEMKLANEELKKPAAGVLFRVERRGGRAVPTPSDVRRRRDRSAAPRRRG